MSGQVGTIGRLRIAKGVFYVAIVLQTMLGGSISIAAEMMALSRYDNISLDQLQSIYDLAYKRSGFKLKKEETKLKFDPGTGVETRSTRHYFEFSVSGYPNNIGLVYVQFDISAMANKYCAPCIVTTGSDLSAFIASLNDFGTHSIDYAEYMKKLRSAQKNAINELDARSPEGKGVRSDLKVIGRGRISPPGEMLEPVPHYLLKRDEN